MASTTPYRQDLPPPGGYKPIQFERIPAKKVLGSYTTYGLVIGGMVVGYYLWHLNDMKLRRLALEARSARFAERPMLVAEKDRAYLNQLRKNRIEEERLMANVPGWEVGTLYGEPIYKTRPTDEWHDPITSEYFVHSSRIDLMHHVNLSKYI